MRGRTSKLAGSVAALMALALAACGGAQSGAGTGSASGGDQLASGAKVYASRCSGCHGANAEGGSGAPALVGKGALPLDPANPNARKMQFKLAEDVFRYAKATMPPNKAGSLSDEQYYAVVAFLLKGNGVAIDGKHLDASSASSLHIR